MSRTIALVADPSEPPLSMTSDMQLVVEMFPAQQGDAFLIRILAGGESTNILVDAGPLATYRRVLRPRLAELASAGEDLTAFIVTHIDADHIEGAIEFLADNGESATPTVIRIHDVWHNSYRHLAQKGPTPTGEQVARVQEQVSPRTTGDAITISARHGSTLAGLLRKHGYPWNAAFDGESVVTDGCPRGISFDDKVHLTLLSPRVDDLAALARVWRRELLALGAPGNIVDTAAFEEAFERVIETESATSEGDGGADRPISARQLTSPPDPSTFREDRSIPNASSIAFLLEAHGKKVLFMGDARPSTVVEHLRSLDTGPIEISALKLSHHGSRRNTSPELCSFVRATHYLVSTDGSRHGHPDMEALLWLVSSQPSVQLHFNYQTPAASAIASKELIERFGHTVFVGSSDGPYKLTL